MATADAAEGFLHQHARRREATLAWLGQVERAIGQRAGARRPAPRPPALSPATLREVRRALVAVLADPDG